ncbi:site-specific integrase [Bifidobacterium callimiconis]|uniref:tyrosine-type recombinase/integrase n=1 Tax=Bifidobacterium callimiconis TaxID=2306973 RepID=UPI001BDD0815|nr:site-specific integrase [Bifidobacterium callimiconis]MBT1176992.1 site-specific integrase [Bifidobacterium callimiconis]
MASIESYTTKKQGRRYRVIWRDSSHKKRSEGGFTRKKDALAYKAQIEAALHNGDYIDPKAGGVTISDLAPTWLEGKKGVVKPSYQRDLESAWKVHVEPQWGSRQIGGIQGSEIQAWVSSLAAGDKQQDIPAKSPSVVLRAYGVLKGICDMAVKDRLIRQSPCDDITLPRKTRKPRTYLTVPQLLALADASGEHRALILTLGFCGIRYGEARGLRVRSVDFAKKRLRVETSVTRVKGEYVESMPKNWEIRDVPIPATVLAALQEQCEGRNPEDLVFPGHAKGRWLREVQRTGVNWFSRAIKASGVPSLTPHDLRHTAASIAVSSGANVKVVQRMLGHKSAEMTLERYADLFDSDLDSVAASVDSMISDSMGH